MPDPTVILCIDGFDPEYLDACQTPNLREMAAKGFMRLGRSIMPSVTNVNNVSLVTASYPAVHGICSNYRLVRETGEEIYMESGEYVLSETMFQRAQAQGKTSILVTSKDKLRTLLAKGATYSVSSERPPDWIVEGVGPPPAIYSLEVNGWAIRAASYMMSRQRADLVYVTTTDYAMHTYAPEEPQSQIHMSILDRAIGELAEAHPRATVLITADHGMSTKSKIVDLGRVLARHGIEAHLAPIIKDRYVVHHSNLGGVHVRVPGTRRHPRGAAMAQGHAGGRGGDAQRRGRDKSEPSPGPNRRHSGDRRGGRGLRGPLGGFHAPQAPLPRFPTRVRAAYRIPGRF